ncbi:MAG TPA: dTDP-glucose 4,6-dehydratase [Nitrosopumilaceae archaeon]|nr:dTDP-glucose 4,6-dehydratase [Nitrosopumilaceae archaeon]
MKILVTGGLGFIGSNFILHVQKNYPDFKIVNLDAGLLGSNEKNLKSIEKSENYRLVHGNINDKKLVERLSSDIDGIINFAAESHVDRSIHDSKPFLESNIMGVYTLLDTIREKKPKIRFMQISTDEVFGSLSTGYAKEKDVFRPSNPYAASKASAELIAESYTKTYDMDVIITRCTNNFGPRQFPEKLIPKTIIRIDKNMKIPVYGTGKNIRDWLYVEDHCDAIMKVFLNGKTGESYNISSSNESTNITLIEKILELMSKPKDLIYFVDDRPGHDLRYGLDSTKIRHELGWKPQWKFEEELQNTINWYQQNRDWWEGLANDEMLDPTPWKKYRK